MKIIPVILLVALSCSCYAQTDTSKTLNTQTKLDIGYGGIGLSYEPKLANSITFDITAGLGGYCSTSEDKLYESVRYNLNPVYPAFYFGLNPKFFYNLKRRADNNKSTAFNSGNYIGLKAKYVSQSISSAVYSDEILLLNLHWGLQRAIGKSFTVSAFAGAGYAVPVDNQFDVVYPTVDFKFSYLFGKPN